MTVSEGVGVGLLLNGQLVHGAGSMAGEFGHVSIDEYGPPCRCGRRGCWERYASNSAAVQHYLEPQAAAAAAGRRRCASSDLARLAARQATAAAIASLDRMGRYLGIGLANLATGLAPDVIVIVGEVTARGIAWARGRRGEGRSARCPTSDAHRRHRSQAQPRLRGAVTLVVQQHFGAPRRGVDRA